MTDPKKLAAEFVHNASAGFDHTTILYELEDKVATLTLNGPERLNALAHATVNELDAAIDKALGAGARALIITGAGRAFSSGGDLISRPDLSDVGKPLEVLWNPLAEKLLRLPIPVITAVNGLAAGAGVSLALMSDFVIAERAAYFTLAFIKVGLVQDFGATWLLTRLIGRQRATEMLMLSERISAQRAESWGMVYKVVDDGTSLGEARQLAQKLAKGPTAAYAEMRKIILTTLDGTLTESLQAERVGQKIAGNTHDFTEGLAAFRDKRPPNYTGS
jgi:2-(1,2-epoxy-1,2-dihydrophenyl)acetyl-CoA isomerase